MLAGAGGYNTAEVIELAKELSQMGADGILSVTPYYNKPTQEGLVQHFKAIAKAVPLPIVVYSIQGRTGVNVEPATLKRLAEIDNIVGVKEASGNIGQMATVLHLLPETFTVLSGDDAITIPLIALGGRGVISVVANEIPAEFSKLTKLALAGDFRRRTRPPAAMVPADGSEFLRSESRPGEGRDGHDGLARAGFPAADGSAVGGQSREDRSRAQVGRPARCCPELACKLKSKHLFDHPPAAYHEDHFMLFARLKEALNTGAVRAAEPDRLHENRLARERVGQERHPAGISHRRNGRYVGGCDPAAVFR